MYEVITDWSAVPLTIEIKSFWNLFVLNLSTDAVKSLVDLMPITGITEDNAFTALALLEASIVSDFAVIRLSITF